MSWYCEVCHRRLQMGVDDKLMGGRVDEVSDLIKCDECLLTKPTPDIYRVTVQVGDGSWVTLATRTDDLSMCAEDARYEASMGRTARVVRYKAVEVVAAFEPKKEEA